jgi:hypothetical protein
MTQISKDVTRRRQMRFGAVVAGHPLIAGAFGFGVTPGSRVRPGTGVGRSTVR